MMKGLGRVCLGVASAIVLASGGEVLAQSGDELQSKKVSKETIGAWAIQCSEVSGQKKQCNLAQTLVDTRRRQPLASWVIGKDGEGVLTSSITIPAGVNVSAGITIQIGDRQAFQVPFKTCVRAGCVAQFQASSEVVNAMAQHEKATVTMQTLQEKDINLPFSLSGFTRAYESYQGEQS